MNTIILFIVVIVILLGIFKLVGDSHNSILYRSLLPVVVTKPKPTAILPPAPPLPINTGTKANPVVIPKPKPLPILK